MRARDGSAGQQKGAGKVGAGQRWADSLDDSAGSAGALVSRHVEAVGEVGARLKRGNAKSEN